MRKLLEHLAATAELMGQQISPVALSMMAKDLEQYPVEIVIEALALLRRESKGRMSLASVIEQIERMRPDGRPGPDEAWAMIPRDESTSVVMTEEMGEALHVAQPLLDEGDQIAARMAFKEAYARIVDQNKRAGTAPKWFPSLGSNKEGREAVLAEAVRLGRLGSEHAAGLLPPDRAVPMLEQSGANVPAIEKKPISKEQALENIARIKAILDKPGRPFFAVAVEDVIAAQQAKKASEE